MLPNLPLCSCVVITTAKNDSRRFRNQTHPIFQIIEIFYQRNVPTAKNDTDCFIVLPIVKHCRGLWTGYNPKSFGYLLKKDTFLSTQQKYLVMVTFQATAFVVANAAKARKWVVTK